MTLQHFQDDFMQLELAFVSVIEPVELPFCDHGCKDGVRCAFRKVRDKISCEVKKGGMVFQLIVRKSYLSNH